MKRLLRRLRWYVGEISGQSAYDHYLAHHERDGRACPPLSRREFYDLKTNPSVRCC